MSSLFSDVKDTSKQYAHDVKSAAKDLKDAPKPPVPAFVDLAKSVNDLLTKDFYHTSAANLEVKNKTPNGVNYTVKGKSAHEGPLSGSLEGKYTDSPSGTSATLTWTTTNALDAKVELDGTIAKDVKAELLSTFKPDTGAIANKANLFVKQPGLHFRVLTDLTKGPTATADVVLGHEGFLVGGEASYDVQKAALTKYSAAIGYQQSVHHAAITASNNLTVFSASYYNKVNHNVEAGAKATWDSKTGGKVGLELASKYIIDPTSFAKAKINDQGIAALAYNVKVKQGFTFGIGASFDSQKLNEGGHKVGTNFIFEN